MHEAALARPGPGDRGTTGDSGADRAAVRVAVSQRCTQSRGHLVCRNLDGGAERFRSTPGSSAGSRAPRSARALNGPAEQREHPAARDLRVT